ncbi:serine/threonine protein kinase [Planctomyces sp. SH-PL62]|uniref:serine/threonine protein kinase n=1 Tax=Planctomyces sp. SH-PL62 TaxID=1636152 RepID=UPI00078BA0D9|nr:serine/threonine-protein kinase [Planctomyces sp. SH-PL62]AMV38293.1 Serine/threonine-protein kinase PknB [Planctomyces sp. SH-PL62]
MATSGGAASAEDRIGAYRVVRVIHAGVTSVVMEVVDETTHRRYVVKQLAASRCDDASERRKFAFEAKLGLELRHPNLIRVHEFVNDREQPYFVMEYFPGLNLKLPLSRPTVYPMPREHLHKIIRQAASGLAFMHEKGWVHRDVKPENILADRGGETRVIDYTIAMRTRTGLARLFAGKVPRQGTGTYMAPEQIRCESPAPTADIYSFGATCYELACGRPPFRAGSQQELLNKHLREKPLSLISRDDQITPEFNEAVLRMLQKRPEDRFASLQEFLAIFRNVRISRNDPDPRADNRDGPFA